MVTIEALLECFHTGDQVTVVRNSELFKNYPLDDRDYSGQWTIGEIFRDGSHYLHRGQLRTDAILDMLEPAGGPW